MAQYISQFLHYLLTRSYIPLILLNPALILHLLNTTFSHLFPPPPTISHTHYPLMESIGPLPGSTPWLDMHENDGLCWRYTAVMVVIQYMAFQQIGENIEWAETQKVRRRKLLRERLARLGSEEEDVMKGSKNAWMKA